MFLSFFYFSFIFLLFFFVCGALVLLFGHALVAGDQKEAAAREVRGNVKRDKKRQQRRSWADLPREMRRETGPFRTPGTDGSRQTAPLEAAAKDKKRRKILG